MSDMDQRRRAGRDDYEIEDILTPMDGKALRDYARHYKISLTKLTKKSEFKGVIRRHFHPRPPPPIGEDEEGDDHSDSEELEPAAEAPMDDEESVGDSIPIANEKMSRAAIIGIAGRHGLDFKVTTRNRKEMVAAIEAHIAAQAALHNVAESDADNESEEERVEDEKTASDIARREEIVREREREVSRREKAYLESREDAIEARERAIEEKEKELNRRKRKIGEADPDYVSDDPRPHKRRKLEAEVAEELAKDLPRPEAPEFIEKKHADLKRQRDGEDFKIRGKDVKQWYDAELIAECKAGNERWIYKKGVGEGAYGSCSIWVRANDKLITDVDATSPTHSEHTNNNREWF